MIIKTKPIFRFKEIALIIVMLNWNYLNNRDARFSFIWYGHKHEA